MMSILSSKAEPMLNSIDSITSNLNALLAEYQGMSGEVRKIMTNVQNMTANFNGIAADNRQNIKQITDNAASISKDLAASQKKLEPILAKMNTFADSLNAIKMAGTINKANTLLGELNKTMTAINQQKGSAGKLVYNDSLYNNLNKTLEDLDKLFIDLKAQPKRYVHFSLFGKKNKVMEQK
jgi:phospholipid/cholesterol/gamma-HCH transport system substrate-binding protein